MPSFSFPIKLKNTPSIYVHPFDETKWPAGKNQGPLKLTHKVVYVFSNFLKCVHTEAAVREISDALSQTAWKPCHTEETRQDCVTNNKTKEQNFGPNK